MADSKFSPNSYWGQSADAVKVAVGILSAAKLGPQLEKLVPIGWLSYLIGALVSAIIINTLSEKIFARPTLRATWYIKGKSEDIATPVIQWPTGQKIGKYEVHLRLEAPSLLSRVYLSQRIGDTPTVRIEAGSDSLLQACIESSRDSYAAFAVEGRVQCCLDKTTDCLFQAWVCFSWEKVGAQPAARLERPVKVTFGTEEDDRKWLTKVDSSVIRLALD